MASQLKGHTGPWSLTCALEKNRSLKRVDNSDTTAKIKLRVYLMKLACLNSQNHSGHQINLLLVALALHSDRS